MTEDYEQFRELLKLYGYDTENIDRIIARVKKKELQKEKRTSDAYQLIATLEIPETQTPIQCIIDPYSPKLKALPYYMRYVGYIVSAMTNKDAAKHLGMNEMMLWRVLKDLRGED